MEGQGLPGGPPSWGPLQGLCCSRGAEAGEAHDLLDSTPVSRSLNFGEEETVSNASFTAGPLLPRELAERGELALEDGSRYRGQWRGQHRHGHGVLVRPEGQSYEGGFEQSRAHGHGIWRCGLGGKALHL